MFFARRTILALSVMMDIAQHAGHQPVSAKDLAERHGVLPRFFEIMLKTLANAGLIRGQRGPKGGYQLAREMNAILVADIVTAIAADADKDELPLPQTAQARLLPYLGEMDAYLLHKLQETTLGDLLYRKDGKTLQPRSQVG